MTKTNDLHSSLPCARTILSPGKGGEGRIKKGEGEEFRGVGGKESGVEEEGGEQLDKGGVGGY